MSDATAIRTRQPEGRISVALAVRKKDSFTVTSNKVLPLEEAREGLRLIQDREVIGKGVVTP